MKDKNKDIIDGVILGIIMFLLFGLPYLLMLNTFIFNK